MCDPWMTSFIRRSFGYSLVQRTIRVLSADPLLSFSRSLNFCFSFISATDAGSCADCANGGKPYTTLIGKTVCDCLPGFTGAKCENEIDFCLNDNCKWGYQFSATVVANATVRCENVPEKQDYRCICAPGGYLIVLDIKLPMRREYSTFWLRTRNSIGGVVRHQVCCNVGCSWS